MTKDELIALIEIQENLLRDVAHKTSKAQTFLEKTKELLDPTNPLFEFHFPNDPPDIDGFVAIQSPLYLAMSQAVKDAAILLPSPV